MDIFDLLLPPIYLIIILFIAYKYKRKHQHQHDAYRYFLPGLIAKFIGALGLGFIYFFYYKGGDTTNYHFTANALINVLFNNPEDFMYIYFGSPHVSEFYLMNSRGDFTFWVNDEYAYFVSKCFVPVVMFAGRSYMASAIIVASICYISVWKMYMIFVAEFPTIYKQLAIPVLFIPSVIFWGSGLLKDSLTFSATCLYLHGFYWFIIKKKFKLNYVLAIVLAAYMLLSIKPYILFALLPGSIVWFVALRVNKINNGFIKVMIAPFIIVVGVGIGGFAMQKLSSELGQYSLDKVLNTASEAQQDLKQSYYGGNTFDIGNYEPTIAGVLSVAHKAIFAALFRPTILDVRNIVMFISALENTFILFFCIFLLIKLKVFGFFRLIKSHPLVLFSFLFSIFFAFSVGVSISNFGTLVRLKIPCMPFFLASLVIINNMLKIETENKFKIRKKQNTFGNPKQELSFKV
jgi:hypothetical protein